MNQRDDAAALRRQGHRLTPQRLLVLSIIQQSGRHLTADEIHSQVVRQQPYFNIATVYRTLQWLQQVGLVAPILIDSGPLRYEYCNGEAQHHHLVCRECGSEQEISDDILATLKTVLLERYGFSAQLNHLALPGRCAHCCEHAGTGTSSLHGVDA